MNKTTRLLFFSLIALSLSLGAVHTANAQFGIAGGVNFEGAEDLEVGGDDEAVLDNQTGYHFGVVYDFDFGPASIRPGVIYRRVGTYNFEVGGVTIEDESFDISVIEVPLDARFSVLSTPAFRPYVLAGPMMSFPRGDDGFSDATKDISFSLNVGVGAEFGNPDGITVLPELRYEFGATKFINDSFEIAGQEFDPQNEPRFSAFSLRLHILF